MGAVREIILFTVGPRPISDPMLRRNTLHASSEFSETLSLHSGGGHAQLNFDSIGPAKSTHVCAALQTCSQFSWKFPPEAK